MVVLKFDSLKRVRRKEERGIVHIVDGRQGLQAFLLCNIR